MTEHQHGHGHHHGHQHGHVHLDEADWSAWADGAELEGEVLLQFVTDTMDWVGEFRDRDSAPVRRIIDIGSGPGVGTVELAKLFAEAHVVAVDSSLAMLARTAKRAEAHGVSSQISTRLAELPAGLEALEPADVIWASMSLHHVGDEVAALRLLRDLLAPGGLIAVVELAGPTRVLPDDIGIGRRGLIDRIAAAGSTWFADMRAGLPDSVPSADLASMVSNAGFDVLGARLSSVHIEAPLSDDARRFALTQFLRAVDQFAGQLDQDDLDAIAVLTDPERPDGIMQRPDVFVTASRHVAIGRPNVGVTASPR